MFKDIINNFKIPEMFIVTNLKIEDIYNNIFNFFNSVYNILTQHNVYPLKVKLIITDIELALVNSIKNVFLNSKRISCFFHYKYDIRKNMNKKHFFIKDKKKESLEVLEELEYLSLIYKGNITNFDNKNYIMHYACILD